VTAAPASGFARSRERLDAVAGWLSGPAAAGLTHGELEEQLEYRGRELLRGSVRIFV
jgi:hypothetical protein